MEKRQKEGKKNGANSYYRCIKCQQPDETYVRITVNKKQYEIRERENY